MPVDNGLVLDTHLSLSGGEHQDIPAVYLLHTCIAPQSPPKYRSLNYYLRISCNECAWGGPDDEVGQEENVGSGLG